jgi:hypothetical protein
MATGPLNFPERPFRISWQHAAVRLPKHRCGLEYFVSSAYLKSFKCIAPKMLSGISAGLSQANLASITRQEF